jgi:hypothetical protein
MLLDMAFAENVSYLLIFIYLFYLFIYIYGFFPFAFCEGRGSRVANPSRSRVQSFEGRDIGISAAVCRIV